MVAHREAPYRDKPLRVPLPASEEAWAATIILPLYPDMTHAEQDRVVAAIAEAG
jgi:perosamine synthetase